MVLYETERLIIRAWQKTDAEDLFEYASDLEVTKSLTFETYTSIKDAHKRIKHCRKHFRKHFKTLNFAYGHEVLPFS